MKMRNAFLMYFSFLFIAVTLYVLWKILIFKRISCELAICDILHFEKTNKYMQILKICFKFVNI